MNGTISIVGAGRLGKTLGYCLRRHGWRIGAVVTRSKATSRAATRVIGAGTSYSELSRGVLEADIVLLTTPDSAIELTARALARLGRDACRGKIFLHTSGALDRTPLAPLARAGAATGSLHPMQTFSGHGAPRLTEVIFAVEGDPRARRVAKKIARSLGGIPVELESENKPTYHAAGALVAGHALALMEAATRILMQLGFSRRLAMQTLLPLTRQMLDNFERVGPRAAWTGPVARGDYAVVAKHMKALRRYPPEFRQSYAALARLAMRVLCQKPGKGLLRLERTLGKEGGIR